MQDFSCCNTSPNLFIILKLYIVIYFYIKKWILKLFLTFLDPIKSPINQLRAQLEDKLVAWPIFGLYEIKNLSCFLKNWEYKLLYYLKNERKSSHFKIIKKLILSFVKRIRKVFISIFEIIIKGIFLILG